MTKKSKLSSGKREFSVPYILKDSLIVLLVVYAAILFGNWLSVHFSIVDSYNWFMFSNYGNEAIIALISGFVVSLSQFKFLHKKSKCVALFSLGKARSRLFYEKAWRPLFLMLLITGVYYVAVLVSNIVLGFFSSSLIDEFLSTALCTIMLLAFGYTVGVFSSVFTGKMSEAVVFGIAVSTLPFILFNLVDALFRFFLKGYFALLGGELNYSYYIANKGGILHSVLSAFDPLFSMMPEAQFYFTTESSDEAWMFTPLYNIIKSVVWIIACVVAITLLQKYFSGKYKPEFCDKQGRHKTVSVLCSMTIPMFSVAFLLCAWCFISSLGGIIRGIDKVIFIAIALLCSVVTSFVLNLVLYREKSQIKYSFCGFGIVAIVTAVICIIANTGGLCYTTYIPDSNKIKSVMISDEVGLLPDISDEYFDAEREHAPIELCFTDKDDIELVKKVHKFIAEDDTSGTTTNFNIIYQLENGTHICRTYRNISNRGCEEIEKLWETATVKEFYKTIFNQKKELNSKSESKEWSEWEHEFVYNNDYNVQEYTYNVDAGVYYSLDDKVTYRLTAIADGVVLYSKDDVVTRRVFSQDFMQELRTAMYKDYCSMTWEQFFKPEKQIGVIGFVNRAYYKEENNNFDFLEEDSDWLGVFYSFFRKFPITTDMYNTISVLKKADVYKCFEATKEIEQAHLIDSQKLLEWMSLDDTYMNDVPDVFNKGDLLLSARRYFWGDFASDIYLTYGCKYSENLEYLDDPMAYSDFTPIPESDIEIITPERANKLREDAFMTYNAGNDCKFLVMKYTDGTAGMLVISQ